MRYFVRVFLWLILALGVTGCNQDNLTYDYLMQHPASVQKVLGNCHAYPKTVCDAAHRAEDDFFALTSERDINPQQFGMKILAAENELVAKEIAYQRSHQAVKENPAKPELNSTLQNAFKEYQAQNEKVKTYLAVVAAGGSPQ